MLIKEYHFTEPNKKGSAPIKIYDDADNVWQPHDPTIQVMRVISENYRLNVFGSNILDAGTGCGILGIYCLNIGAKNVTFTDTNRHAVLSTKKNLVLNGYNPNKFVIAVADGLNISAKKFDIILSNPPAQPITVYAHLQNIAYKSNENTNNGRYLLDQLISSGRRHLTNKGKLIFHCSSRHGHDDTIALLDQHWHNKWRTLWSQSYPVDPTYHGPYIQHWLEQKEIDNQDRIVRKRGTWHHTSYIIECTQ